MTGVQTCALPICYAREHKVPFLGLCLGMQCAVIEVARDLAGIKDAASSEFDSQTPDPVIDRKSVV